MFGANLVLLVLYSIVVLAPVESSSALNSLVEEFSHSSLEWLLFDSSSTSTSSRGREKRQKDSTDDDDNSRRRTSGATITDGGNHQQMPTGEDGGTHCLVRCLKPMINKAPQDAGNETLICPKYDSRRIEELCQGYLQARRCLDECPESALKNLSMSGFKPLQFMCVDRSEDFKKYMPCLASSCDEVQTQCEPTCGSLDESVRRLARIQQQVRGPGSRSRGADLDIPEIMQTVADNCQLVGCVGNCSREPMIRRCGSDAYDLQRDTIWTMLSSMAQAMSSIGLNSVWPPQCQQLVAADKLRHAGTTGQERSRDPNSTDRFVDKQTPADDHNNNTAAAIGPGRDSSQHVEPVVSSAPTGSASSTSSSLDKNAAMMMLLISSLAILNSLLRPIMI